MSLPLKSRDGEGEGGWGKGRKNRRKLWVGEGIEFSTGWHLKDGLVKAEPLAGCILDPQGGQEHAARAAGGRRLGQHVQGWGRKGSGARKAPAPAEISH